MTKKIQNKGTVNAHILLGAYWLSKVLGGRHPLKAAIDVLDMERRLVISEAKRTRAEKKAEKKRGSKKRNFNRNSSDKKVPQTAEADALPSGRRAASASVVRSAAGIARSRTFIKAARNVLRSAKVI